MRDDIEDLEIPVTHQAIKENLIFLDKLVLKIAKGWTLEDVAAFLAEQGYQPQTQRRFLAAVRLRYERLRRETKRRQRRQAKPERSPDDHRDPTGAGGEEPSAES